MANPLYQMFGGGTPMQQSGMMFQNPMQRMQYIMQAMTNPAAFVRQRFPDIPENIQNDPNQILGYLQRTRGISDQQIQQVQQMAGQFAGSGMMR